MNIHIYNLFYICTGTHACMGFVPDNKLIRIRIRIRCLDLVFEANSRDIEYVVTSYRRPVYVM